MEFIRFSFIASPVLQNSRCIYSDCRGLGKCPFTTHDSARKLVSLNAERSIAELPSTVYSCIRHDVVAARLTSYSRVSILMSSACAGSLLTVSSTTGVTGRSTHR